MANCIIAQSGGPTSVINSSVVGLLEANNTLGTFNKVFAGLNGIEGILNGNIIELSSFSQEEINNFAKLTPVQKVLYIKEHFSEDPGIFKYIDVNTYNQRNVREKGYTGQSLYFHDNIENIEDILIQSKLDSFNKKPYIKIA